MKPILHHHRVLRLEKRTLYRHRLAGFYTRTPLVIDPIVLAFNFDNFTGGSFLSDFPVGGGSTIGGINGGPVYSATGLVGDAIDVTVRALSNSVPIDARFLTDTSFSGCFWVKATTVGSTTDLINWAPVNKGYIIQIDGAGVVTFYCGNGTSYDSVSAVNPITSGAWFFVAFSRNHAAGEIYVEVSSTATYTNLNVGTSTTYAGSSTFNQLTMSPPGGGLFDLLRLWKAHRNDAQFQTYWNGGAGVSYPP